MPVFRSTLALTLALTLTTGSLVSACSFSGTVVATGAVGMIAGGVLMAQQRESGCVQTYPLSCAAEDLDAGLNNGANLLLGGMIVALSAVMLTAGIIGVVHDEREHSGAPDAKLTIISPPDAPREEVVTKLAEHIQIAASTRRCHVTQLFAEKLARLDDARLRSLIEEDPFVARCLRNWAPTPFGDRTSEAPAPGQAWERSPATAGLSMR